MTRFVTVQEVAELFGVHEATVWRWIATGRLRAIRPGTKTLRIQRDDLEKFIKAHEVTPTDKTHETKALAS